LPPPPPRACRGDGRPGGGVRRAGLLRAGGQVGDPLSVLPVLLAIVWRGRPADLGNRGLGSGSTVWAPWGGRADGPASGAASGDTLRLGGETHGGRAGERQGAVGRRRWGGDRGRYRRAVRRSRP